MSVQWCDVSADDWESVPDNPPRTDAGLFVQQIGDALVLSHDGELVIAVHDVAERDLSTREDYQDGIDRAQPEERDESADTADT